MTRPQHQRPALQVPLQSRDGSTQNSVPTHWSPEQVTVVFEFLDVLREEIWSRTGLQIQPVLRNDRVTTHPFEQTDIDGSHDPF